MLHPHQEVGIIVLFLAVDGVGDGKAQVLILGVADDFFHVFQDLGHLLLPRIGVGHHVGNMAPVGPGLIGGPGGVEIHIAGGAQGVIRSQDGLEGLLAGVEVDDGLVDAVSSVVGELQEQQQLRKGIVLEDDALAYPAPGQVQELGEEPGFHIAIVVSEVFLQHQFSQEKDHLLLPAALEVVQGVDAGFADNGGIFRFDGNVGGGEDHLRVSR